MRRVIQPQDVSTHFSFGRLTIAADRTEGGWQTELHVQSIRHLSKPARFNLFYLASKALYAPLDGYPEKAQRTVYALIDSIIWLAYIASSLCVDPF